MPRAPFAIMIAMTSFLALPIHGVHAQEAASDATTPMDKQVGNQQTPQDDTLSNTEVKQLMHQENTTGQQQTTGSTLTTGEAAPAVSGTTAIYKEKSGSAAKTEGGAVTQ